MEFSADALSLRVSGVSMFGDQASCPTCAPSTEAVVAMRWNGSAFEAVSSWFDTANGAVAAPDQAEAQGFYDAVAAEDYAAAARHASQDDIARLRTEGIAGCAPDDLDTCGMRAVQFPVGGQVGTCGAIPDVRGSSGEFTIPGDPLGLAFAQSWFTGQPYQQGDFVCGIDTSPLTTRTASRWCSSAGRSPDRGSAACPGLGHCHRHSLHWAHHAR